LKPGPAGQVDLNALAVRWFDHWLRDVDNGIDREPPAHVYALGVNEWRDYPAWPPPDAQSRTYYLTPGTSGDLHTGGLSRARPAKRTGSAGHGSDLLPTRFRYDPADPV